MRPDFKKLALEQQKEMEKRKKAGYDEVKKHTAQMGGHNRGFGTPEQIESMRKALKNKKK